MIIDKNISVPEYKELFNQFIESLHPNEVKNTPNIKFTRAFGCSTITRETKLTKACGEFISLSDPWPFSRMVSVIKPALQLLLVKFSLQTHVHRSVSNELSKLINKLKSEHPIFESIYHTSNAEWVIKNRHVNWLGVAKEDPYKISFHDYKTVTKVLTDNAHINNKYDNYWNPDNRKMMSMGSFLRQINPNATDYEIESAHNAWCVALGVGDNYEFREVDGEDIRKYYHGDKYSTLVSTATLESSCMRYNECQDWLSMYTSNPQQVRMVIRLDPQTDMIVGRALLWTDDSFGTFMDRIYGNDLTIEIFKNYAKTKKYSYKHRQSYDDKLHIMTPENDYKECVSKYMEITLEHGYFDKWPYVDTFTYSDDLKTFNNYNDHSEYHLVQTNGNSSDEEENMEYVERYSESYPCEEVRWSEYYQEHVLYIDCTYLDSVNDYIWDDRIITLANGEMWPRDHDDIVCCEDGDYRHTDDCYYVESESEGDGYYPEEDVIYKYGDWYHKSDLIEHNGEWYLPTDEDYLELIKEEELEVV